MEQVEEVSLVLQPARLSSVQSTHFSCQVGIMTSELLISWSHLRNKRVQSTFRPLSLRLSCVGVSSTCHSWFFTELPLAAFFCWTQLFVNLFFFLRFLCVHSVKPTASFCFPCECFSQSADSRILNYIM